MARDECVTLHVVCAAAGLFEEICFRTQRKVEFDSGY